MRLKTIFLFTAALATAAPAKAEVPTANSFAGNYLAARSASRSLDLDATIAFAGAALKHEPTNGVILEQLMIAQVMKGEIDKAEAVAPQVLKSAPQERVARMLVGLKAMRSKQYAEARSHFTQTAYTPDGMLTAVLLTAWAYAGENNLNAALHELGKLDSQDAMANEKAFHAALITDLLAPGRADAAYKKAIQLAPLSLLMVQAYGNFLERQGRKDDADKLYRAYLQADPGNVFINKAADALAAAGKPAPFVATAEMGAAESLFSTALQLNSEQSADAALTYAQLALPMVNDKPFAYTTLGEINMALKQFEAAVDAFEKVSKDSVLRDYADVQVAISLEQLGKDDAALARLKDLIARNPKSSDAYITLGGLYRGKKQDAEAVEAYSKALELMPEGRPNIWRVIYQRASSLDRLKKYDLAEADFRKALKLSHDNPDVLNYLGYSMIDRGVNLDEALAMVKKAVNLKPNDGFITDSLGWAYYTLRNYADATSWCERAVDLRPSDPILNEHLGDVYWRVGRELEARFQWQHALDSNPDADDIPRITAKLKDGLPPDPAAAKPSNG